MNEIFKAGILTLAAWATWVAPSRAGELIVPGTGSAEVIVRELAHGFNASNQVHQVVVPPSTGSDDGIRGVLNNEVVLARVSKPPKEADVKKGLRYAPFARDAVIFAAGSGVTVTHLTTAELADIFAGKITDWRQVGGSAAPIRVLIRENFDSKFQVIRTHLKPFQTITFSSEAKLLHHTYEMVAMLDRFDMSIGWVTHSTLIGAKTPIKALSIDSSAPTPENVLSGKYKLVIDFGLVYNADRLNDAARKFIDYVFSEPGRRILEKNGLVPIPRART